MNEILRLANTGNPYRVKTGIGIEENGEHYGPGKNDGITPALFTFSGRNWRALPGIYINTCLAELLRFVHPGIKHQARDDGAMVIVITTQKRDSPLPMLHLCFRTCRSPSNT